MSNQLVSVIIPSFKMGQFIGEALESVGAQTYPHWEVIVVDDAGPEDGTRAAVEAFAAKHPGHRVEYIRHETNRGVSIARRTAFGACRGEFIAFLDADDRFVPEKLRVHVADLKIRPACVMVHGPIVDDENQSEPAVSDRKWFYNGEVSKEYFQRHKRDFLRESRICNSTMVCRRAAISIDDFPEKMTFQNEDKLLWLMLSGRGSFYYKCLPMTRYRRHESSYTTWFTQKPSLLFYARLELMLHFLIRQRNPLMITAASHEILSILLGLAWWCSEGIVEYRKRANLKVRLGLIWSSIFQRGS